MTVYVVTKVDKMDSPVSIELNVYADLKEAEFAMLKLIDSAKEAIKGAEMLYEIELSDDSFDMWRKHEYDKDYVHINIHTKNIIGNALTNKNKKKEEYHYGLDT